MNVLPATIKSIISSQELSCVNVQIGTDEFHLFLVEILDENRFLNTNVKITFKETEVILLQAQAAPSSANSATAVIEKIEYGAVLTQVTLVYKTMPLTTLVATPLFERLHVSQGDTVTWMVQPSEISLLWSTTYGI
jgi:molybdopterin-binding protein